MTRASARPGAEPARAVACVAAALLLGAAAPPARAQPAPNAPRAGDHVRVRVTGPAAGPVGLGCEAPVAAVAADTLVLARRGACPRGSYEGTVAVFRGHDGSRSVHAVRGVLVGAIVGGVLGRVIAGDGCTIRGCDDGGLAIVVLTVFGAGGGGVVGGVLGALMPAGPRWQPADGPRPIRVAGLAVRPAVRVALGPGR